MVRSPNILWIVTTQWRAQACGYAGDANARTPNLDRFAAESVNYPQAVTPHPFGPFARAAILTGIHAPDNGVRDYFDPLPTETRTIAHELNDRGYATAFFGKWHLGKRDPRAALVGEAHARIILPPAARGGFGFWEGFESGFLLNDPWLHGTEIPTPRKFDGYQSDVVCRRAAEWISGYAERTDDCRSPWFGVVSLESPHPPYDAPAAGVTVRDPDKIVLAPNVPRGGDVEGKARRELAGYYAHIEATDRAIGRLIAAISKEDTIVVFTSVHGDMHGAHGLFRKGWPHEESVRVPLLVRLPPIKQGSEFRVLGSGLRVPGSGFRVPGSELVSLVDLSRWTLAWAERREPGTWNPELGTQVIQRISMPSVVALPLQCDRAWRGIRTTTRKLILNADDSPWLFFDLQNDPFEMTNLADDPMRRNEIDALRAGM